jgi:hypothetical protein
MPLFNFVIHDRPGTQQPEPIDLPDLRIARSEAVVLAGQLLKDADGAFWEEGSNWRIDVADEDGLVLYSVLIIGIAAPAVPEL